MSDRFWFAKLFAVAMVSLALSSCGGTQRGDSAKLEAGENTFDCIAVMPTQMHQTDEEIAGHPRMKELQLGADYLNYSIDEVLRSSTLERIIDADTLNPSIEEISGGITGVVREVGKRTKCDYVLLSTVMQFRQRQGSEFAADQAASVSFQLRLLQASTGQQFWSTTFAETQESLFNNLFSFGKAFKRGFKWVTVEELAYQGVKEKLMTCPYIFH